jgi:demethylmenaquinone methyltransferase/2-methoxy-6-polyprenyl-1,4-benzoquinol methylase
VPIDHFGLLASAFDRGPNLAFTPAQADLLGLPCEGRLLDAGGGTGRMADSLRALVGEAVVADVSPGMLRRAGARGLPAVRAAAEQLPFPGGAFDRVVMRDAFHHLADQDRSSAELWRVLAAGGRLVIIEPDILEFSVKLLAVFEKLMLMRSHFLTAERIAALFSGRSVKIDIFREAGSVWIVVKRDK